MSSDVDLGAVYGYPEENSSQLSRARKRKNLIFPTIVSGRFEVLVTAERMRVGLASGVQGVSVCGGAGAPVVISQVSAGDGAYSRWVEMCCPSAPAKILLRQFYPGGTELVAVSF